MKKKLFIGASLLLALLVTGCNPEPEQTKPTDQDVYINDVKSSGAEKSVQALKDEGKSGDEIINMISEELQKQMENAEIQDALEEAFKCITNLQPNSTNNNRSITVNELGSEISDIEEKLETFTTDLVKNGKASISYTSTPGNISDLDSTGVISVDISKFNFSTNEVTFSTNKTESQLKGAGDIEADAKGRVDFTKAKGLEDFIIKEAILTVGLDADVNLDYKSTENLLEEYEFELSGKLNASFTANSAMSLVIPYNGQNYGGKILLSASFKINCDDLAEINTIVEKAESTESVISDLEKYFTLNISSDLYTDDGKKVCELIKITKLEDLEKYFPSGWIDGENLSIYEIYDSDYEGIKIGISDIPDGAAVRSVYINGELSAYLGLDEGLYISPDIFNTEFGYPFTTAGKDYKIYVEYENKNYQKIATSNVITIRATSGFGEFELINEPKYTIKNNILTFNPEPKIQIGSNIIRTDSNWDEYYVLEVMTTEFDFQSWNYLGASCNNFDFSNKVRDDSKNSDLMFTLYYMIKSPEFGGDYRLVLYDYEDTNSFKLSY